MRFLTKHRMDLTWPAWRGHHWRMRLSGRSFPRWTVPGSGPKTAQTRTNCCKKDSAGNGTPVDLCPVGRSRARCCDLCDRGGYPSVLTGWWPSTAGRSLGNPQRGASVLGLGLVGVRWQTGVNPSVPYQKPWLRERGTSISWSLHRETLSRAGMYDDAGLIQHFVGLHCVCTLPWQGNTADCNVLLTGLAGSHRIG